MRGPPRSPSQLLKVMRAFKEVDGWNWGFGGRFSNDQKESRMIVAHQLGSRGISKDLFALVRNYEASLSKLGLLYVNENKQLTITNAGKLILEPKYRSAVFLEQFIKFRSFRLKNKRTNLFVSEKMPFVSILQNWHIKDHSEERLVPWTLVTKQLFSEQIEGTGLTYTDTFLKLMEATSIVYYQSKKSFAFLLNPLELSRLLRISRKIALDFWGDVLSDELSLDQFFDKYGELKNYGTMKKYVLSNQERSKQIRIKVKLSLPA